MQHLLPVDTSKWSLPNRYTTDREKRSEESEAIQMNLPKNTDNYYPNIDVALSSPYPTKDYTIWLKDKKPKF